MINKEKWIAPLSTTEPYNHIGLVQVRQNNKNSETWFVPIVQNGEEFDMTEDGITEVFFCTKFLGKYPVEQRATIVNAKKGHIKYIMSQPDMQKPGIQQAYFKFVDKDGNYQGSTQSFSYKVIPSIDSTCSDGGSYIVRLEELFKLYMDFYNNQKQDATDYHVDQIAIWEKFFKDYREIIESIDPGGVLLKEIVEARGPFKSVAERLDLYDLKFQKLKELPSEYNVIFLTEVGISTKNSAEQNSAIFDTIFQKYGNNHTYVFPAGQILINRPIVVRGKQIQLVSFSRTEIKANDYMDAMIKFDVETSADINQNIYFDYLYLNGNNRAKKGLYIQSIKGDYTSYCKFERITAVNCLEDGIYGTSDSWVINLSNCHASFNGRDGFRFETTKHSNYKQTNAYFLDKVISIRNSGDGVTLSGISHTLRSCNIEKNGGYAINLDGKSNPDAQYHTIISINIDGGYIEGNMKGEIRIVSYSPGAVNGVSINNVYFNHLDTNPDGPQTSIINCVGPQEGIDNFKLINNSYNGVYKYIVEGGNTFTTRCDLGRILQEEHLVDIGMATVQIGVWEELTIPTTSYGGVGIGSDQWTDNILSPSKIVTMSPMERYVGRIMRDIKILIDTDITDGTLRLYRMIYNKKTGALSDSKSTDINIKPGKTELSFNISNTDGFRRTKKK